VKNKKLSYPAALLMIALMVIPALNAQGRRQQPPEYREIVTATRMEDAAARLKELERIKSAYPDSQMMALIDSNIMEARIDLASSLDDVLDLQKKWMASAQGARRLTAYMQMADQLLNHSKLDSFAKSRILSTMIDYKKAAKAATEDPALFTDVPENQKDQIILFYVTGLNIPLAQAYLYAGQASEALESLKTFKSGGGSANITYNFTLGEILAALGQKKEAYEAYISAAVESSRGDEDEKAAEKARALYMEMNGSADGFETALEAKAKELPFHVDEYEAPSGWKGKAVLAELFTGSECPPCVGADLGFDGLLEAYPRKYLVVLEYHLPIPRPDPMMNPATKLRQDYYGVSSTPTVIMEGTEKMVGGGNRGMAEGKYTQYKAVVDRQIGAEPGLKLEVRALIKGDVVSVDYVFDKVVAGADYHVVLVQDEQEYQGSNGLKHHKMVVRDLVTVDTSAAKKTRFDLAASEKATDAYLTEFAETYTRIPNFKWSVRHNSIARKGLKVVFFAQDRESKAVLNTVIADVK
jgi:tetratricopeptide (TPR) repeat protein